MLNLAGDLTFGVCVTFSSAALPGRVLQELWAGESRRMGCDCAWKGEAPAVLFSNRTQLWLNLSPINVSKC